MNKNNNTKNINLNNSNIKQNINLPIITFRKCLESDCFYGQKAYHLNPKTKKYFN